MLDWQKKQVEELMKLPDFDMHPIISNYDLWIHLHSSIWKECYRYQLV